MVARRTHAVFALFLSAVVQIAAFSRVCAETPKGDAAHVRELIPHGAADPMVFFSPPNAFAGKETVQTKFVSVDGARLFGDVSAGTDKLELVLKVRATDGNTKAAELGLHQSDGKTWGFTFPLEREWKEIRRPMDKLGYFSHWGGMPKLAPGETIDLRKLANVHFSFGKWLCRNGLDKPHGFEVGSLRIERARQAVLPPPAGPWDRSLADFPRHAGETDDTGRLRRAVDAVPSGVLYVPRGTYSISSMVEIWQISCL